VSPLLVALTAAFFAVLFSQFGHRLPARRALIWWLVAGLLLAAAIDPEVFRPVTRLLGIELVSNFVLAAMVMFLFVQSLEHQAESARSSRQIAQLTSAQAAAAYPHREGVQVLVVLPCLDEEGALPQVLGRLEELAGKDPALAYCVVDDGSSDRSPAILRARAPTGHVRHASRIGVSGALYTGLLVARRLGATTVVQCDADGQHPVGEIPRLLAEARARGADLLVGARQPGAGESTTRLRRLGAALISAVLRLFGRHARVTDPTSGFRVYSARAVEALLRQMPDEYPEPESIALLAVRGLAIAEAPVEMLPRQGGRSSLGPFSGARYVAKVAAALIGLRLRSWRPGRA
jgi:hypothetical protein